MSNNFYNHGSFPTTGSAATSASMRAELDSIAAGFDKMPTLTGNANEIVVVNGSGTALDSIATLPATSGGTGLASYAVGDLLYAATTTALAKLADVATGNALISGGVGVAPSYGKIGLATHVSGTLPIANGGSGATTAQGAMNAFAAATTSGQYLRGNGTNVVMSAIQAADVPTLNQNTSGSAATFTSTTQNSQFNSIGVNTAASGTAGQIRATGDIVAHFSDDRLKTKLGNIEDALAKIRTLSGFYYVPNETAQDLGYEAVRDVGVSAQQVQAVQPEVVAPAPIDEKYLTVRYDRLVPLLIEAIKELDGELQSIKQQLKGD
jgi:hypothetical protein